MDSKTCTKFRIHFIKPCSIHFIDESIFLHPCDPPHLASTFVGALEDLESLNEAQIKFYTEKSRQQLKLNWAASRKNSPDVKIDGSTREGLA